VMIKGRMTRHKRSSSKAVSKCLLKLMLGAIGRLGGLCLTFTAAGLHSWCYTNNGNQIVVNINW